MKKDRLKEARRIAAEDKERREVVKPLKNDDFRLVNVSPPNTNGAANMLNMATQNSDYLTMYPSRILEWLNFRWRDCPVELYGVLMVGLRWEYMGEKLLAAGDDSHVIVMHEQVIQPAVMAGAYGVAIWHSHPYDPTHFSDLDIDGLQTEIKWLMSCGIEFAGAYMIAPKDSHYLSKSEIMGMDVSKYIKTGNFTLDGGVFMREYDPNCKHAKYAVEHGAPVLNSGVNVNG